MQQMNHEEACAGCVAPSHSPTQSTFGGQAPSPGSHLSTVPSGRWHGIPLPDTSRVIVNIYHYSRMRKRTNTKTVNVRRTIAHSAWTSRQTSICGLTRCSLSRSWRCHRKLLYMLDCSLTMFQHSRCLVGTSLPRRTRHCVSTFCSTWDAVSDCRLRNCQNLICTVLLACRPCAEAAVGGAVSFTRHACSALTSRARIAFLAECMTELSTISGIDCCSVPGSNTGDIYQAQTFTCLACVSYCPCSKQERPFPDCGVAMLKVFWHMGASDHDPMQSTGWTRPVTGYACIHGPILS